MLRSAPVVEEIMSVPLAAQSPVKTIITAQAAEPAGQQKTGPATSVQVEPEQPVAQEAIPPAIILPPVEEDPLQIVSALLQQASDPQEMQVITSTITASPERDVASPLRPESAVNAVTLQPSPALQHEVNFAASALHPEEPAEVTSAPAAVTQQPSVESQSQPAAEVTEEQTLDEMISSQPTHLEALPAALVKNPDTKVRILRAPDSLAGETNNLEDIPSEVEATPALNARKYGSFTAGGKPIKVVKAGSSLDDEPQASNGARAGSKK
jgi:hypothetical protein